MMISCHYFRSGNKDDYRDIVLIHGGLGFINFFVRLHHRA